MGFPMQSVLFIIHNAVVRIDLQESGTISTMICVLMIPSHLLDAPLLVEEHVGRPTVGWALNLPVLPTKSNGHSARKASFTITQYS